MQRMTVDEFLWALAEVKDNGVYAKRLKELHETQKKIQEKIAIADSLDKVLAHEKLVLKKIQEKEDALAKEVAQHKAEVKRAKAEVEDQRASVEARQVAYGQLASKLRAEQEQNASTSKALGAYAAALEAKEKALAKQADELAKDQKALAEKLAVLKGVL